jgi:hypothetical protein
MVLTRFGRGREPSRGVIGFLQLAEHNQLAQSSSLFLAQPACAGVRGRYAEPNALEQRRAPVVLGH